MADEKDAAVPMEDAEPKPVAAFSGFTLTKVVKTARPAKSQRDTGAKDFVTAIGEEGLQSANGSRGGLKVIPKLENSWQPQKKMKMYQQLVDQGVNEIAAEERFEVERLEGGKEPNVVYGLNIMKKTSATTTQTEPQPDPEFERAVYTRPDETQQLREDLISLPEVADLDAYESMPVEDFGEAMLRGMGWEKGKPVGRNAKGVIAPVEYVPRQGRLGLGAEPKPPEEKEKKYIKPGETRGPKKDMVLPVGPDGKVRNVKAVGEELVERVRKGVAVGKVMEIVGGRHSGLRCRVLSIDCPPPDSGRSERASVKLLKSDEVVSVRVKELADVENGVANGSVRDEGKVRSKDRGAERGVERDQAAVADGAPDERPWLHSHIRVRIVSKSYARGRLYLKKAHVVDVVTPTTGDLIVEDTREHLQGVPQSLLETVLPRKGGAVVVVGGRHRGKRGKLLEKDSEKERAVVQLHEDFEMVTLGLDQVAELVGDVED